MKFIYKLENKLERFTIPKLYLVIIICMIMGYVFNIIIPSFYQNLVLVPYLVVVNHQYWRLFTWIFTIPYSFDSALSIIFLPINFFFYYFLGRSLENYWGRFMYNLYIIGGAILTDILVLLGAFMYYYWLPSAEENRARFALEASSGGDSVYAAFSITRYMLMSIFLAFTVIGGDHMIYLYFVIPIKMKWLAYVDLFILLIGFITGGFFTRIIIVSSVTNYFIYFFMNRKRTVPSFKDRKRKKKFEDAMKRSKPVNVEYNSDGTIKYPKGSSIIPPGYGNPEGITVHKCAVCGRTEKSAPNLEFRFCSKCNGNYEYCSEHLYTHQHIN